MAESGTTWHFVALAVFQITAPKQLVLIAEAIMCFLISTYALKTTTFQDLIDETTEAGFDLQVVDEETS